MIQAVIFGRPPSEFTFVFTTLFAGDFLIRFPKAHMECKA